MPTGVAVVLVAAAIVAIVVVVVASVEVVPHGLQKRIDAWWQQILDLRFSCVLNLRPYCNNNTITTTSTFPRTTITSCKVWFNLMIYLVQPYDLPWFLMIYLG